MENIIGEILGGLRFKRIREFRNMAVLPISHNINYDIEYITLKEGLDAGTLSFHETNVNGSVPELTAVNTGYLPVLILDGEELAGAKQNRAVNTTIMIPSLSKVNIPVSCTEQGRWSYSTKTFMDSDLIMSYRIRSTRSMSVTQNLVKEVGFFSDQIELWENIRTEALFAHASSPTGAMRDTFEHLRPKLEDYVKAFPLIEEQNGLLVFVNGNPVGMEMISSPDKYKLLHAKLIRSYATEALYKEEESNVTEEMAINFIKEAAMCRFDSYPSAGLEKDYRFIGNKIVGSALVVDGNVVHCAFFKKEQSSNEYPQEATGMLDSRRRRKFRLNRDLTNGDLVF
jgi:hypothetical protein